MLLATVLVTAKVYNLEEFGRGPFKQLILKGSTQQAHTKSSSKFAVIYEFLAYFSQHLYGCLTISSLTINVYKIKLNNPLPQTADF